MARLEWGADDKLWGANGLYWGEITADTEEAESEALWFHALIRVDMSETEILRLWTGLEDLEFDEAGSTNTWLGAGQAIEIGNMSSHTIASDDKLILTFNALTEEYRNRWLVPVGPKPIEVRTIASDDYGISWTILPQVKKGLLSNPVYEDGVYRIQVVHPFEIRQSLKPLNWSHEDQQARHPGDRGLEYMRRIANGVEAKWPNLDR